MRFLPARRSSRIVALGAVGLLFAGAIVGSSTFDGDDASSSRATGPVRQVAGAPTDRGSGGGSAGSAGDNASVQVYDQGPPVGASSDSVIAETRASGAPLASSGEDDFVPGSGSSGASSGGGGDPVIGGQSLPPAESGRVIKSATLQLKVAKGGFDAAHAEALTIVSGVGGFVQNSSLRNGQGVMTLRVPADRFDKVLGDLSDLGEVKDESLTGEDVSEEFVDLEGRLRHWRAQEAVFLDLMTKAESVTETIEVQRQLSMVQQNIEQIEGRRRFLENRTDLATITLTLSTPGAIAPEPEADAGPSLSEAWDQAWDAGVEVIGGTLIVLGALVPLGLIVGLPLLIVVAARRRRGPTAPSPGPAG